MILKDHRSNPLRIPFWSKRNPRGFEAIREPEEGQEAGFAARGN